MPSFVSRIYNEVGNAMADAYGHMVLGDDAGEAVTIAFVARGVERNGECKFVLGLTFLNVNGRAYVKDVDPKSQAARTGIQPRDCLQLALVLDNDNIEGLQDDEANASSYAIQCEKNGNRTTFTQLKEMFENCTFPFSTSRLPFHNRHVKVLQNRDLNVPDEYAVHSKYNQEYSPIFESSSKNNWEENNLFNILDGLRSTTQIMVGRCSATNMAESTSPASPSGEAMYPVVLVFRRTRKRELGAVSHASFPSFRLDDECDRAARLVRRLTSTKDEELQPDMWGEISRGAAEYLRKKHSCLPQSETTKINSGVIEDESQRLIHSGEQTHGRLSKSISPDCVRNPTERIRMESKGGRDANNDVEASTIRGMIQHAMGLAFVRTSKIVLGFSVHFGSGIVLSRLEDGTWSSPSAIGIYGGGFGVQFGAEIVDYIFILQTRDTVEHFRRGGNFTIGGNMGAAVVGVGREAYGAASVDGGLCSPLECTKKKANKDNGSRERISEISPIVAYALSQGLYLGVSLEGSKIFTRDDINLRSYKFTGGEVTANDILTGKVPPPPAAEDLYAALKSVEFTPEISNLPRPPEILRDDLKHKWGSSHHEHIALEKPMGNRSNQNTEKSLEPQPRGGHDIIVSNLSSEAKEGDRRQRIPENRTNFLKVSPRGRLRLEASSKNGGVEVRELQRAVPKYIHDQLFIRDIASNIVLPFPFSLARSLLLDSSSPVMAWESNEGNEYDCKGSWTFPSLTNGDTNQNSGNEHELIASRSMVGGFRKIDCVQNGKKLYVSETHFVDTDEREKLVITIEEQMLRRGFTVKVRILLQFSTQQSCIVNILGELRPLEMDLTNKVDVQKALLLVIGELKVRYGTDSKGLFTNLYSIADKFSDRKSKEPDACKLSSQVHLNPTHSKVNSKSRQYLQKKGRESITVDRTNNEFNEKGRTSNRENLNLFKKKSKEISAVVNESNVCKKDDTICLSEVVKKSARSERRLTSPKTQNYSPERPTPKINLSDRPATPSVVNRVNNRLDKMPGHSLKSSIFQTSFDSMTFDDSSGHNGISMPLTVEVKPLPKIRLCLLPSPREEDEVEESSVVLRSRRKKTKTRSSKKKKKRNR